MKARGSKRVARWALAGLVVVLVLIQFVPVDRSNPPAGEELPFPAEVRSILAGSCFDCHSHETAWPWYSRIAPASWLIAHDVAEGREELNFSTWSEMSERDRAEAIEEIWEEVEEGEMPLWYYLPAHPEARLSDGERAVLRSWALAAGRESP